MLFFHKPGIVNVKMIITEEKILSNIDKVQKMINPNSKKQMVQLDEDAFFKDLIDSIKTYLIEYPKKKNFPVNVYKAAYSLVEYATEQFEGNTKKIEKLIRQRERNINIAGNLKGVLKATVNKDKEWKTKVKQAANILPEDIIKALVVIGKSKNKTTDTYNEALKLVNAKIANLEANLHIEIDMERIEDRSKALSYIGIEIADALKGIPVPNENSQGVQNTEDATYLAQTRFEVKPSLWQRIKNSKAVRAIAYFCKIKVVIQLPALPEGRGEQ